MADRAEPARPADAPSNRLRIVAASDPLEHAAQQATGHGISKPAPDGWEGAAAPPLVDRALATPGQSLPAATRESFDSRLHFDFSNVRIHTDEVAANSAAAIGADAYTVGRDIVFARGLYAPGTAAGDRLLAHELAHVASAAPADRLLRQQATAEWFGGPRTPAIHNLADQDTPNHTIRNNILVEKPPSYTFVDVAVGGSTKQIAIRFAYPASEITSSGGGAQWSVTANITRAKKAIGDALVAVVTRFQNYTTTPGNRTSQILDNRLTAMLTQFTKQRPLNIFLSVNPLDTNPLTDAVTINAATAAKEAATLIPAQMFSAARLTSGGATAGAATPREAQTTVLHESTHDALIRSNADFVSVWNRTNMQTTPVPSGPLANKFLHLMRAFIVAQEEDFAYTTEESLYPPPATGTAPAPTMGPQHRTYLAFISATKTYLQKKGLTLKSLTLPVVKGSSQPDVASWKITYEFPSGTVNLSSGGPPSKGQQGQPQGDEAIIDLLLTQFSGTHGPARFAKPPVSR